MDNKKQQNFEWNKIEDKAKVFVLQGTWQCNCEANDKFL